MDKVNRYDGLLPLNDHTKLSLLIREIKNIYIRWKNDLAQSGHKASQSSVQITTCFSAVNLTLWCQFCVIAASFWQNVCSIFDQNTPF